MPAFVEEFSGVPESPQCNSCIHYLGYGACLAFPEGIPVEFLTNTYWHDGVFDEQQGDYTFQKR